MKISNSLPAKTNPFGRLYKMLHYIFLLTLLCYFSPGWTQCSDDLVDYCGVSPAYRSRFDMTLAGYWRIITANGIPDHSIGIFPLTNSDPVVARDCGRPNALREQDYTFVMPAFSSRGTAWGRSEVFEYPKPPFIGEPAVTFGVALNGVPFDPAAAEWWDVSTKIWEKNPLRIDDMANDLDCNNGHVQPDGSYHYHGFPNGLFNRILHDQTVNDASSSRSRIVLLGWAFDGNPIYAEDCGVDNASIVHPRSAYELKSVPRGDYYTDDPFAVPPLSTYPRGDFVNDFEYNASNTVDLGYLDQCHGHAGPTPEFPNGVYHHHILQKTNLLSDIGFPYIGRCYRLFLYERGPDLFPR